VTCLGGDFRIYVAVRNTYLPDHAWDRIILETTRIRMEEKP
jgi:hypothetical protein